jgi:hypothetical protein
MPTVPLPPRRAAFGRRAGRAMTVLLLAAATGELIMNTPAFAASPAASAVPAAYQRVLTHLAAAFGLQPGELEVLSLAPRDLPEGATEFYVEAKGSHGHGNHNCVVMNERVYCSGAEGEFERLLREQALLRRPDLTAARLMRLYSLFALPRQLKYVDANVLARDPQPWSGYPEVTPPALTPRGDGGVTLVFHATPVREIQPSRWTVDIAPDGEVRVASTPVARR